MRWTAWWSIAILGVVATSCGGDSGGSQGTLRVNSDRVVAQEVSTVSGDCAQLGSFFSELLNLTNSARQDAGLGDLEFSYQLGVSAQTYAEDLATQNFFSHTGEDGSTLQSRIDATGYQYASAGENLAAGQSAAHSVFQGWMNSAGHRANILQADFTEVGFGLFDATGSSDYGRYWVQNFGKPQGGNSRKGVYIPDTCGLSVASGDRASNQVVAGISITNDLLGVDSDALPGTLPSTTAIRSLASGQVPVNVLAATLASGVAGSTSESVPEPAALLGLGGLGWLLWRDQKKVG